MKNTNIKTINGKNRQEAMMKAKKEYGDNFSLISTSEIKKGLVEMSILVDNLDTQAKQTSNPYDGVSSKPISNKTTPRSPVAKDLKTLKNQAQIVGDELTKILEDNKIDNIKKSNTSTKGLDPKITAMKNFAKNDDKTNHKEKVENEENEENHNYQSKKTLEEIETIKNDIKKLMGTLKSLQGVVLLEKGYSTKDFTIPPEFSDVFRILNASGIKKRHLQEIFKNCIESMPVRMKENPLNVQRYFKTLLNNMILTRKETFNANKRKIIMLVGSTGVGKTTSIAKIAARYCYGNNKNNVGIITLDNYRLGALDQIMTYAKIMKLSIQAVVNPTEFVSAINKLHNCDYILIDTAGSSPYNTSQINSIKKFLQEDDTLDIDVSLVMATNTTGDVMADVLKSFSTLDIDTLILTKLDETRKFGPLFSFLFDYKKPISYLSMGQEVPDDFEEANKKILVDHLFDTQV